VRLPHRPGALADLGEALGRAGISLEGGGGFTVGDHAIVHFLVADGDRAAAVLRAADFAVLGVRDVVVQRVPVGFNASFIPQQKLYYALLAMGKLDEVHTKVFQAIHVERDRLAKDEDIFAWISKQGLDVNVSDPQAIEGVEFGYALSLNACTGCRQCEYACAAENNTSRRPEMHYITVLELDIRAF